MKRRVFSLILCLALMLGTAAQAAESKPAPVAVVVNGETIEHTAQAHSGTTYVSLYHVTMALLPEAVITWGAAAMISVSATQPVGAGQDRVCFRPSSAIEEPKAV